MNQLVSTRYRIGPRWSHSIEGTSTVDTPQLVQVKQLADTYQLLDNTFRGAPDASRQQVRTDFPLFFAANNLRNRRVISHNGQVICHAGFSPLSLKLGNVTLKTAVVVLVATHPDYRRRGCAALCMKSLQQQLQDEGYDLGILWTGVPGFYEPLGWKTAAPPGRYLNPIAAGLPCLNHHLTSTPPFEIQKYSESHHFHDVMTLQRCQPVRTMRSPADFRQLLSLPRIQAWAIQRKTLDAYVVTGTAVNKYGILEYAGRADDILAGIAKLVQEQRLAPDAPLPVFGTDSKMASLLHAHQIPMTPLVSSKGRGTEMRLILDRQRVNSVVEHELFVWGLDWA
ncbi:MAG: GNAT family N-acetyltransferase [Planctomycetota bacterium]|nr:GNAT family N-acetyltransferase [Planctomycetota bacterium]